MPPTSANESPRAAWIGLGAACALAALAMTLPAVTGWNVHVKSFPPLHAEWDPRVGPGTLPAMLIALLGLRYAATWAATLSWRRLLGISWVLGVAWMLSLAL